MSLLQKVWRDCPELAERYQERRSVKHKAHKATEGCDDRSDSDALLVGHALSVGLSSGWIVDSGTTSHICNDKQLFTVYQSLKKSEKR